MGASIAAHLANAGMEVLLLDLPAKEAGDAGSKNERAAKALERLAKMKPSPLFAPDLLERIEPGNFEDDMPRLNEADWIIEAVVENLEAKSRLLEQVERHWRPGTIVSTNTSGLSVNRMIDGRSEAFQRHFLGTHFFNPPRYMKLLELIPASAADPELVNFLIDFCENKLGKGVVIAKDTPNFIANRIGTYSLLVVFHEMNALGLSVSEVDELTGALIGRPKSATFRTLDLVGLDTFLHVAENVRAQTKHEEERSMFTVPDVMKELVALGRLGEKSGKGFYEARVKPTGEKEILQLDLKSMQYVARNRSVSPAAAQAKNMKSLKERLRFLVQAQDEGGRLIWNVIKKTCVYAASKIPEIADDCLTVDRAMRWGFNWELGPFELWDALGVEKTAARMEAEGEAVPDWVKQMLAKGQRSFYVKQEEKRFYVLPAGRLQEEKQPSQHISLRQLKEQGKIIRSNSGANLIDLGDDVACLEFVSPNNAIGPDILQMTLASLEEVRRNYRGLVIGNEGRHFCVGANLMMLLMEAQDENWPAIDQIIQQFQQTAMAVKYFEKPVVSAPFGMTLGGGVELAIPAAKVQASAETYMGLVEAGVGLIPAGGGTKELLMRCTIPADFDGKVDLQPHVNRALETIGMAKVSGSAREAVQLGFLRENDGVTMNKDRLLWEAKQSVIGMSIAGYSPPEPKKVRVVGEPGLAAMKMGIYQLRCSGRISDHDALIAQKLAHVLAGGTVPANAMVTEQDLLDLEREAFLSLCGEPKSQARMQHMLLKGKPLRN